MEVKLKEILFRSHTVPMMKNIQKANRKITGMTSGNTAAILAEIVAYKQSKAYQSQIAEIEMKKAQALAEAYRLSLR